MEQRAAALLEKVGLSGRLHHQPSQLSGGEQQRVAIARSLVDHPQVLFADEPTGNLDSRTSEEILAIFQQLNQSDRITLVMVTHDPGVAQHAQTNHPHQGRPDRGRRHACKCGRRHLKIVRTLKMASLALRHNIMRAALTTLGIIIGVAAVITMMEIGMGPRRPSGARWPAWAQIRW